MPRSGFFGCAIAVALVAAFAPIGAGAQPSLKIFDSHLHYNQEPSPLYSLDQVLDTFRRNNVAGILSNSRPNKSRQPLWPRRRIACAVASGTPRSRYSGSGTSPWTGFEKGTLPLPVRG